MSINFKHKDYAKNRNSLSHLLNNPFRIPFSSTLMNFLKEKNFTIIDKKETCEDYTIDLYLTVRKLEQVTRMNVFISKDHLIYLKLKKDSEKKVVEIKTRDPNKVLKIIGEL